MERREYTLMDAAEGRMWWYRALHDRLADALVGVRGRVLDAGCGTGGMLVALGMSQPALELVGLEWDGDAARRAREKSGAAIVCGNVNALPFCHASFDAVIVADVLCHRAVEPMTTLAELHRVLRPGGRLVVNMPAYAWLLSVHDRKVHNARRWTARGMRDCLAALLDSLEVRTRYWNGLLLPLMVLQRKLLARGDDAASDVAPFSPWLDATLHAITVIERRLPFPLPAGGSVLATAIRPPDP